MDLRYCLALFLVVGVANCEENINSVAEESQEMKQAKTLEELGAPQALPEMCPEVRDDETNTPYFEDPYDCNCYYVCDKWRRPMRMCCHEHLWWHPISQTCYYKEQFPKFRQQECEQRKEEALQAIETGAYTYFPRWMQEKLMNHKAELQRIQKMGSKEVAAGVTPSPNDIPQRTHSTTPRPQTTASPVSYSTPGPRNLETLYSNSEEDLGNQYRATGFHQPQAGGIQIVDIPKENQGLYIKEDYDYYPENGPDPVGDARSGSKQGFTNDIQNENVFGIYDGPGPQLSINPSEPDSDRPRQITIHVDFDEDEEDNSIQQQQAAYTQVFQTHAANQPIPPWVNDKPPQTSSEYRVLNAFKMGTPANQQMTLQSKPRNPFTFRRNNQPLTLVKTNINTGNQQPGRKPYPLSMRRRNFDIQQHRIPEQYQPKQQPPTQFSASQPGNSAPAPPTAPPLEKYLNTYRQLQPQRPATQAHPQAQPQRPPTQQPPIQPQQPLNQPRPPMQPQRPQPQPQRPPVQTQRLPAPPQRPPMQPQHPTPQQPPMPAYRPVQPQRPATPQQHMPQPPKLLPKQQPPMQPQHMPAPPQRPPTQPSPRMPYMPPQQQQQSQPVPHNMPVNMGPQPQPIQNTPQQAQPRRPQVPTTSKSLPTSKGNAGYGMVPQNPSASAPAPPPSSWPVDVSMNDVKSLEESYANYYINKAFDRSLSREAGEDIAGAESDDLLLEQKFANSQENTVEDSEALSLDRYYANLPDEYIYGHCTVQPNPAHQDLKDFIWGSIDLRQSLKGGATELRINMTGFNKEDKVTQHGFHIHEYGDLSTGCESAGSHYDPFGVVHGGPADAPRFRHFGDLGNVTENGEGEVVEVINDLLVSLLGPFSVLGRAIVIHEKEDDLGRAQNEQSLLTGNAGSRLACCTIGLSDGTRWADKAWDRQWEQYTPATSPPPTDDKQQF